jgi:hypothetical protein
VAYYSQAKMSQGTKRSRTEQHDAGQAEPDLPGREQLLFTGFEMQTHVGQKYCDGRTTHCDKAKPLAFACSLLSAVIKLPLLHVLVGRIASPV